MRIALVTSELYPQTGGIQTFVAAVAHELGRRHSVGVIAGNGQTLPPGSSARCLAQIPLARPRSTADQAAVASQLRSVLGAFAPDVVHFASAGLAVYVDAVPPGTRRVVTIHGNDVASPWQRVPGSSAVRRRIVEGVNGCDAALAVSAHTAAMARALGVGAPITVVRPGCDLDRFSQAPNGAAARRRLGIPAGAPVVLTVSRVAARKGHLHLMRALELAPPEWHWLVVGDGPERRAVQAAVASSPVARRCSFTGPVADAWLPAIYACCDLFAATPECRVGPAGTDSEGFGIVFHEAGASARPVLATATAGVTEAVIDGVTGVLVAPGDPPATAAALERFLDDPDLRQRLGAAGRRHVNDTGGWPSVGRATEAAYLLDRSPARGEHLDTQPRLV